MTSNESTPLAIPDAKTNFTRNNALVADIERQLSSTFLSPSAPNHLSPFSTQVQCNTPLPCTLNNTGTPIEPSPITGNFESGHYSDIDDSDPFFGVDFSNVDGDTPSFMNDDIPAVSRSSSFGHTAAYSFERHPVPSSTCADPLDRSHHSLSSNPSFQLVPNPSRSDQFQEDHLVPPATSMAGRSPRVTVSLWGKHDSHPPQLTERYLAASAETTEPPEEGTDLTNDFFTQQTRLSNVPSPKAEYWMQEINLSESRRGVHPNCRPATEIDSINDITKGRKIEERKQAVTDWLSGKLKQRSLQFHEPMLAPVDALNSPEARSDDGIPLGSRTENKYLEDQVYFLPQGGEMSQTDMNILHANRWGNSPMIHPIYKQKGHRFQPESSNAAIAEFSRRCQDNDSIVSKTATWGTRRRSLPNLEDMDAEGVTSGRLFKRLSVSRDQRNRRSTLFRDLRGLMRRPSTSQLLKRARSHLHDDEDHSVESTAFEKRNSFSNLAPDLRSPSRASTKVPMSNINTALASMGSNVASIGSTHARSGSIGAHWKSMRTPSSDFQATNKLQARPRSKSELPKSGVSSHSTLVDLWRRTGGPPVATLAASHNMNPEEDEENEVANECDNRVRSNKAIEGVDPTFAGFQRHILRLNPNLEMHNRFLIDRIAHHQVTRYETLIKAKLRHTQLGADCASGSLCVATGGSANILGQTGPSRGVDLTSPEFEPCEDEDGPVEGAIRREKFPLNIPMPHSPSLPAAFECQLCFQIKRLKKPSDWTKHVHEDIQPFTCTWEMCKEPQMFKRKADWVRHENEGHRHLEWWTCDVEDCQHTCYRRDNFLQHLIREHNFPDLDVKTKPTPKRSGELDPTSQKIAECHVDADWRPQNEPCRFCGKTFPTWKKLTVHLAKHMEEITLPVIQLAEKRKLEPGIMISPAQGPAPAQALYQEPNQIFSNGLDGTAQIPFPFPSTTQAYDLTQTSEVNFGACSGSWGVTAMTEPVSSFCGGSSRPLDASLMSSQSVYLGFSNPPQSACVPAPTISFPGSNQQQYMSLPEDLEPFPTLDQTALGLQLPDTEQSSTNNPASYDMPAGFVNMSVGQHARQGQGSPCSHETASYFYSRT